MSKRKLYSIGQASSICDVSQRMLRYYEEIGLITPDHIDISSRYRYYSFPTMRQVQIIRYLIDEGFSLDDIREMMTDDLEAFQDKFTSKIDETQEKIEYYHQRLNSLKAWTSLIVEGRHVLRHKTVSVDLRYIHKERFFYYNCKHRRDVDDIEAYLETEYFTRSKKDGHSMVDMGGAFYVLYDSYSDRMSDIYETLTLLQIMYPNSKSLENTLLFGGFPAISCYHIGSLENISETYSRMIDWAKEHDFTLQGNSCERHVLDIYSTKHEENYVTEILLPVAGDHSEMELFHLRR